MGFVPWTCVILAPVCVRAALCFAGKLHSTSLGAQRGAGVVNLATKKVLQQAARSSACSHHLGRPCAAIHVVAGLSTLLTFLLPSRLLFAAIYFAQPEPAVEMHADVSHTAQGSELAAAVDASVPHLAQII